MITSLKPKTTHSTLIAITLFTLSFDSVRADSGTDATTVSPSKSTAAAKRVVVWDGEKTSKGAGWVNANSIEPQKVEAHSGDTAPEFKFKGKGMNGLEGVGTGALSKPGRLAQTLRK